MVIVTNDKNALGYFVSLQLLMSKSINPIKKFSPKSSTRSFGRIEEDQFGRRTRIRRGFAKRMNVSIFIDKNTTDFVKRQFEELRETPALWVGVNEVYDSTTIYGDYKDFSIVLTYPDKNNCSIEIEGIA